MCTTCGCAEGNLYIEGDEHNPHSAFRSAPFAPAARPALNITGIKSLTLPQVRPQKAICITATAKPEPTRLV
ncbi:hydrogenase nickel incorporation protein HypB [Salmonella enterica subsp. enterica serovar Gaminara str. ATCC BAA-711]|nr:hydrogenase nickel incorporation protein HypB [Salmonella enterica subsp. enterica serovar Gaminara str. ATCC BAA-711]